MYCNIMDIITLLGFSIIILYCVVQILKFYGLNEGDYGVYIVFFIFIIISLIVLPNQYPSV
jgi:hypothetical protein